MKKAYHVFMNIQTTGISEDDEIVRFAAVKFDDDHSLKGSMDILIRPHVGFSPDAISVHGITEVTVANEPSFRDVSLKILRFIGRAKIYAHNAKFEIGFLNRQLQKIGVMPIAPERVVDTLAVSRRKTPMGPNSIYALCERYGVVPPTQNDEIGLCMALAIIYRKMTAPMPEITNDDLMKVLIRQNAWLTHIVTSISEMRGELEGLKKIVNSRQDATASNHIKKLASMSYALAKQLEERGQ